MESRVNYTIVGFFVVLLTLAMVATALWLTENLQSKPHKTYLVYMTESVAGLSTESPVKYNGVDVGYVGDMKINLQNPQQVILSLEIDPSVPITQATTAVLMSQGLTGMNYIGLKGGHPGAKPLELQPGEQYPVIQSAPSFLVRLDQSLQDLTSNITSLTINVQKLMSQQNLTAFQETLQHLNEVSLTLANNREKLDRSLTSLDTTLKNTAQASQQLPELVNHLNNMSKNMSQAGLNANQTLRVFSTQVMPEAYSTLETLKALSSNLQGFSGELQQDPAILLHGKAPAKPGPGE